MQSLSISLRLALIVGLCLIGIVIVSLQAAQNSHERILQAKIEKIEMLSESAVGILQYYHDRHLAGDLSLADAQDAARDALRDVRFGADDYYYAYDFTGVNWILGPAPERESTVMIDLADPNGVPVIRELIQQAQAGGGIVAYDWPRAGSDAPVPKIGYALPFAPWDWLIGTGVYVDDVETAYWQTVRHLLFFVAGVILVVGLVAIIVSRSIQRGIKDIATAMSRLSRGDTDTKVPYQGLRNEIGSMAEAVETFRLAALEKKALEDQQATQKAQAEADRRTMLNQMAQQFEDSVGQIVTSVSSAATEMRGSAETMAGTATSANNQAEQGLARAEQASNAVHTVAAAAEELGASIVEISRQMSS